jgi:hypothetical protein
MQVSVWDSRLGPLPAQFDVHLNTVRTPIRVLNITSVLIINDDIVNYVRSVQLFIIYSFSFFGLARRGAWVLLCVCLPISSFLLQFGECF